MNTTVQASAREQNIEAIVHFIEAGIKSPEHQGGLGIELEHIVCHTDLSPVGYSDKWGVAWLLEQLKSDYPDATYDSEGDILGVARKGAAITIEPAAQVELSAGPFNKLKDAEEVFTSFESQVNTLLNAHDEQLLPVGYHPSAEARTLELIPKQRYKFMNKYLSATDSCGPCMMRGSASTQISIDYTSTADCLRKMRLAYALVPILSLICDNSTVFEGKPRTHQLVRTYIWQHMDNDRCGLIPGALDEGFTLEDYAAYILDTPAILVPDGSGGWRYTEATFGEEYATTPMTQDDVAHALSMFFPDVRLKTYVEIRPADSMPVPYVIAYAALIKGLFYNETSLSAIEKLFSTIDENAYEQAKAALMEHGYAATVYGKPAHALAKEVLNIAQAGLDEGDLTYLSPLADLINKGETLATIAEKENS